MRCDIFANLLIMFLGGFNNFLRTEPPRGEMTRFLKHCTTHSHGSDSGVELMIENFIQFRDGHKISIKYFSSIIISLSAAARSFSLQNVCE